MAQKENHKHNHSHGACGHSHAPVNYDIRFALGISLNIIFVVIELFFGNKFGSTGLIADAVHNLGDVFGLVISWLGFFIGKFKKSNNFTFGLKNATIIASFVNALILLFGVFYIFIESYTKLSQNNHPYGLGIMAVAGVGIIINMLTAFLFLSGSKNDLNIKGAYLHMMFDALISLGVVLSGALMLLFPFGIIDILTSIAIGIIIIFSTWGLFKESLKLLFSGVPAGVKYSEIESMLLSTPNVKEIHDLHIWALSTTQNALSVHIITTIESSKGGLLKNIQFQLKEKFKITHTTIQIEDTDECEGGC
jgi:cobalt-zinc-cadmium efflux system protein